MQCDVLILTVNIGQGHTAAAEAIKDYFAVHNGAEVRVTIINSFDLVSPVFDRTVTAGYLGAIRHFPSLWGTFYGNTENKERLGERPFLNKVKNLVIPLFDTLLKETKPKVIVATHPFPAAIISRMKEKGMCDVFFASIVTDFRTHPLLIYNETDRYYVSCQRAKLDCLNQGVPGEKIIVSGVPINSVYSEDVNSVAARERLGLDSRPVILLAGGGSGIGGIYHCAKDILDATGESYQLLVVCGNNKKLYKQMSDLSVQWQNLHVFGYCRNMPDLYGAADILISKCGGLTMAEASASGLPVLIINPISGHEERNAEVFEEIKGAVWVRDIAALPLELNKLLIDKERLETMSKAMADFGHRDSVELVATDLMEIMKNYC